MRVAWDERLRRREGSRFICSCLALEVRGKAVIVQRKGNAMVGELYSTVVACG
jgi:hypothetical protein